MKVLIIVLTWLDNGIYQKFYNKQNETWDSIDVENTSTFYYINQGVEKKIEGHFIINNLSETLQNAGYKMLNCFEKTIDWDYDYIFHTNSSSYVDKKKLYEWLKDKPREEFYSGVVGYHDSHKFASGCGFSLSKDVVRLILNNKEQWVHADYDDLTLGILLNQLGVDIYPAPRFDFTSDSLFSEQNIQIPTDFFHYRCKTTDRNFDVEMLSRIHNKKNQN